MCAMSIESIGSSVERFAEYVRAHLAESDYDLYVLPAGCGATLTFIDFEGFDDEWFEMYRDFENGDAIYSLIDALDANFERYDAAAYYRYYIMNGFVITVGFSSDDI